MPSLKPTTYYHQPGTRHQAQISGTQNLSNGRIYAYPFYVCDSRIRVTGVVVDVASSDVGKSCSCAIYTWGVDDRPWRRLAVSTVDGSLSFISSSKITIKTIIQTGRYFVLFGSDSGAAALTSLSKEQTGVLGSLTNVGAPATNLRYTSAGWAVGYDWPVDANDIQSADPSANTAKPVMMDVEVVSL